jgi:hypothetical protein
MNLDILEFFTIPDEWKNNEHYSNVPEMPTKYKKYNLKNIVEDNVKFKNELLSIVSFYEIYDSISNGFGDFFLDCPYFYFNHFSVLNPCITYNINCICSITRKEIEKGEKVVLLRDIVDDECNYYIVSYNSLKEYIQKNYTEGEDKTKGIELNDEQISGEIHLTKRWSKDIIKFREDKENFRDEIFGSIQYLTSILEKYNPSLLEEYNL